MTTPDDQGPVRDSLGRILPGVTFDSTDDEIAEAITRRDADDALNRAERRRLGISNGFGPGWG